MLDAVSGALALPLSLRPPSPPPSFLSSAIPVENFDFPAVDVPQSYAERMMPVALRRKCKQQEGNLHGKQRLIDRPRAWALGLDHTLQS